MGAGRPFQAAVDARRATLRRKQMPNHGVYRGWYTAPQGHMAQPSCSHSSGPHAFMPESCDALTPKVSAQAPPVEKGAKKEKDPGEGLKLAALQALDSLLRLPPGRAELAELLADTQEAPPDACSQDEAPKLCDGAAHGSGPCILNPDRILWCH